MVDVVASRAARAAGRVLAVGTRLTAAARRPAKPLHPRGQTWTAVLERRGGGDSGSPWIDVPGVDEAIVRLSRAVGLPAGWPDVQGLALRVPVRQLRPDGDVADVLLASTGCGRIGRFVLRPGRDAASAFLGSLLPYRSPSGPLLVGAVPQAGHEWDLVWATGRMPWTSFGRLHLTEELPDDLGISFDPVLHTPPGLDQYDVWARMRLPAYVTARRSRGDRIAPHEAGTRGA